MEEPEDILQSSATEKIRIRYFPGTRKFSRVWGSEADAILGFIPSSIVAQFVLDSCNVMCD